MQRSPWLALLLLAGLCACQTLLAVARERSEPASKPEQRARNAIRACLLHARHRPPPAPLPSLRAAAAGAAAAQGFDVAANCTGFEAEKHDLSFLGQLRYVTVGNNKLAYRRLAAAALANATPLVLLMG